jgi:hypothetical protein
MFSSHAIRPSTSAPSTIFTHLQLATIALALGMMTANPG